jgi:pilus assembly protein CpaE
VLEQVRSSVPFVVLDMPQIWSDWFKGTLVGADEIIVVAGPDLASLRNGKNMIDFLKAARPNDAPPKLVLNMVGLPKRPEIPPKDFGQAIGVEPTLVLPFDAQLFGTAANNGQMIFDVAPVSKCAQALDQLAVMLSGREIQKTKPSMLKKLMGR